MFIKKSDQERSSLDIVRIKELECGARCVYIYLKYICIKSEYIEFKGEEAAAELNISTSAFYRYIRNLKELKYLKSDNLKKSYIRYTLY